MHPRFKIKTSWQKGALFASIALFNLLEPTFKLTTTLLLMIQEKYAQTSYTSLKRFLGALFADCFKVSKLKVWRKGLDSSKTQKKIL